MTRPGVITVCTPGSGVPRFRARIASRRVLGIDHRRRPRADMQAALLSIGRGVGVPTPPPQAPARTGARRPPLLAARRNLTADSPALRDCRARLRREPRRAHGGGRAVGPHGGGLFWTACAAVRPDSPASPVGTPRFT